LILRPEIEFGSAFPDDSIEGENDFIQWPGRNIAEALKTAFERRGYRVSEPIHAHEHGWELNIWRGRKRLWLRIGVVDAELNYLTALNMTFFLWRDTKLFRGFLSDLHAILGADPRFNQVRWFAKGGIARNDSPAAAPFEA
jgi:hypothetical protein